LTGAVSTSAYGTKRHCGSRSSAWQECNVRRTGFGSPEVRCGRRGVTRTSHAIAWRFLRSTAWRSSSILSRH
jgi:hypothetical protein